MGRRRTKDPLTADELIAHMALVDQSRLIPVTELLGFCVTMVARAIYHSKADPSSVPIILKAFTKNVQSSIRRIHYEETIN